MLSVRIMPGSPMGEQLNDYETRHRATNGKRR
jgi:hypothetical protein